MHSAAIFRLLGPVDLVCGETTVPISGRVSQAVLAALLLEADRYVQVDRLVEAAWGDDRPARARTQAQNRVSTLRQTLHAALGRQIIESTGSSYRIRLDGIALDVDEFDRFLRVGTDSIGAGDLGGGVSALEKALALFRGPALDGLTTPLMRAAAERLDQARIDATEQLIDARLALGEHRAALSTLATLVAENPWRERLHSQLMIALYRSGRQADALAAFEQIRGRLADELGVDPGPDLLRTRDLILREDPSLAAPEAPPPAVAPSAGGCHLPRAVPDFTGRAGDVAALDALAGEAPHEPVVAVVTGTAGVGKTALALHWGHRRRALFPDGQVYVNLRGHGPGAELPPLAALAVLLQALGVTPEEIPADEDAAANAYRAVLTGRRVLVVADNAATAEQVRPLLPTQPGTMVVVTSRDSLTGLVAIDGARRVPLSRLSSVDAVRLLRRMLGEGAVDADPAAAAELVAACAYLPLALRIAGAHLCDPAGPGLVGYVAELRRAARLDILQVPVDELAAVRAAFDRSSQRLSAAAARLFRLCGAVPAPDIAADAAAAVGDTTAWHAAELLDQLAAAHLVERVGPGRYAMHDLLREYANEQCRLNEPETAAAVGRFYDHYRDRADAAAVLAFPTALRLPGEPPQPGGFPDRTAALEWLDAERAVLVAAVAAAAAEGHPDAAWRLAQALRPYFWLRRCTVEWRATELAGRDAATDAGEQQAIAAGSFGLGMADINFGRYADAVGHLRVAAAASRAAGWTAGEASAVGNLGIAFSELGRLTEAAEHYRRAYDLNQQLGRVGSQANNLGNLGLSELRLGDFPAAVRHLQRCLDLYAEFGGGQHDGVYLAGCAQAHRHLGNLDVAADQLQRALAICRDLDDEEQEVLVLVDLALVHRAYGDTDAAVEHARQAAALARHLHDADVRSVALAGRAAVLAGSDPAAARTDAAEAVRLATEGANTYVTAHALLSLADAEMAGGDRRSCRDHAEQALRLAQEYGFAEIARRARALGAPSSAGQST
ncbi:tetratricopeptide repeat protein [Micromonospora sp. C31]|uniref:AfsR/SARP family transcriptional regulator n=1 Tax=Micromonospora sp. C31 TaxID=2824876 RepID=UPI001B365911|nr:BTAD domain-containing putative transcriptional regulator [Micromonospora sp. C31]MBQ1072358.1 tetratricopeptide repeat protein [Micromonospora sp. C31]